MIIVESKKELELFYTSFKQQDIFIIPIYSDINRHAMRNRVSFFYAYGLDTAEEFILPINHSEANNLKELPDFTNKNRVFVLNKKELSMHIPSNNFYDADLIMYFQNNKVLELEDTDTNAHGFLEREFYQHQTPNVNDVIPIYKHYERCINIRNKFITCWKQFTEDKSYHYYNDVIIPNLSKIEQNGLFVDYRKFLKVFSKNGLSNNLTFSQYNIYTITGRPSNRHAGINYNALNKDDESRAPFISRFQENGFLIQFDYDAYHLRLIADIIGYTFPVDINVHDYLGKQYFGKNKLSTEEYEASKTISFRQLYGGVQKEYADIPYFNEVTNYIADLWKTFQQQAYIETPIFGRKLHKKFYSELNKNKLFNYLLQATETERNMVVINDLIKLCEAYNSKIILYTYDSLLFDYCMSDGKEFILEAKRIMENGGRYPTKLEIGSNYHTMKNTII